MTINGCPYSTISPFSTKIAATVPSYSLSTSFISFIASTIPHRSPFLLVDRIEEMEEGKRIVGKKCVTYNEPFFAGHFPQEPVMPGVLIIEALAQTGAVCALSADEYKGKIAFLGGVNKEKFRGKVVPGDVLTLEVEMIKVKDQSVLHREQQM